MQQQLHLILLKPAWSQQGPAVKQKIGAHKRIARTPLLEIKVCG